MAEKIYIPIFLDWDKSTKRLNATEKGRLIDALVAYAKGAEDWEEILKGNEKFLADELRLKIDRFYEISAKRAEAGSKGAVKRWQTIANDSKPKQTIASDSTRTSTSTNTSTYKKENIKERYGEYKNVRLTAEELDKLKTLFPDWEERIERLSSYIASKGDHYKSHYATIRNWANKDGVKTVNKAPAVTGTDEIKRLLGSM